MIQLLQSLSDGSTQLVDAPVPAATGPALVVESRASIVSAGTERALVDFGRSSLLEKARRQPDKVRQVIEKVRTDGLAPTLDAVRAKLDAPIPLGYCNAGVVVDVGPRAAGFAVGDRVVTNGPHAEYVRVPHTLAARIPEGVGFEAAAFTPLAAIGLQGLRLAAPTLGETVVVYGLGLIGLLATQLARAAGCRVIGIDRSEQRVELARRWGAHGVRAEDGGDVAPAVLELTAGQGADAVLLTLATQSDDPLHQAAAMSRKRGRLVLVGVAGLRLRRDDFYRKELSFQVSCSYGPGRYDALHEEKGVDYPLPFVRWTEARNFAAVLDLMADGRLDPLPLVTHRFAIENAASAYQVVCEDAASLGIVLTYPAKSSEDVRAARTVVLRAAEPPRGRAVVACIGAGNFASRVLVPAFARAGAHLEVVAAPGGVSAAVLGRAAGFRRASSDPGTVLADAAVDTVVVATRHDSHAAWAERALAAGKHVFVEKPLALTAAELERVRGAFERSGRLLCVGFNRRFAPTALAARRAASQRSGALAAVITVNAGVIPREHWTQDRDVGGGRVAGEACHFIDLARFLAGSPIVGLDVRTARAAGRAVDDIATITLAFADGSVATVHYLANGSKAFPKERVELFFDGRVVQIDNFRRLRAWGSPSVAPRWPTRQDKGHAALVAAFVEAVRAGGPAPIPPDELFEVSDWTVRAAALAAAGGGQA